MKKNGFTLIELVAVVILLVAIALLTYPAITGMIDSSKEQAYNDQISIIKEAAHRWGIKNVNKLSETEVTVVTINDLIIGGYIDKTENGILIDPRNNEEIKGCVTITYTSVFNQYEYNYQSDCSRY